MSTIIKQSPETVLGGRRNPREQRRSRLDGCSGCRVILLGFVLVFLYGCADQQRKPARPSKSQLPQSKVVASIEVPSTNPQGIVLVKDQLWIIDSKTRALHKIDTKAKRIVDSLKTSVAAARGLAWDGEYFWCADNKTKTVHQINSSTGQTIRTLKVPIYGKRESVALEAVASDRKYLWVAIGAGWSSQIFKMNANTGEVVQYMYANCYPRGLATDGKHLWVVSYNQGKYTGVISRRTIMDDSKKMNLSRVFLCRTQGKEPTGIVFDGQYLWVSDKEIKSLQKIELPSDR